jgi:hypothetical protein
MSFGNFGQTYFVIPAQAGIHHLTLQNKIGQEMDSRLRGNDDTYYIAKISGDTGIIV